jgi:DNA-binding beta-propeller fold protein YncE
MNSPIRNRVKLVIGSLLLGVFTASGATTVAYHLANTYKFGAAPGGREYFDYITVDPASRRIYLSHGTEVLVVNADTGTLEGKISGLKLSHGVALVPGLNHGFITDGEQGKIIIFDLKTLKVIGTAPAANDADSILYDPVSKDVFSFNGDSRTSTVLDPTSGKVVGTIELGGAPEFAVADGRGMIYDNLEDKSEVVAIDSRDLTIKSRWPISPAGAPAPMAIDRDHRRLFVSGRDPQMLVILNADDGKVVQSFPISAGADASIYDPKTGRIFVSTREGWIHIFHEDSPDHFSEAGKIRTEFGAKTMGFDSKTDQLFVDTANFEPAAAATKEHPHPRPTPIPGTFHLLVYAP